MRIPIYRISSRDHLPQDPAGAARTTEGRWHLLGQRVLYFSSSLALSVLELKANAVSFTRIREAYHYSVMEVELSKDCESPPPSIYSDQWTRQKRMTQHYGSGWYLRKNALVLKVKSAVLPTESNYIVNVAHPDFAALAVSEPNSIPLDPRLN